VRRGLGHPPATGRRTEAPSLARERNRTVEPAGIAIHAHEAVREDAAAQERLELARHEARDDALACCGTGEEGLELAANDFPQQARLRAARGVAALRAGIATPRLGRRNRGAR